MDRHAYRNINTSNNPRRKYSQHDVIESWQSDPDEDEDNRLQQQYSQQQCVIRIVLVNEVIEGDHHKQIDKNDNHRSQITEYTNNDDGNSIEDYGNEHSHHKDAAIFNLNKKFNGLKLTRLLNII